MLVPDSRTALRFTFTDDSVALDDQLANVFVSFMSPMRDVDLVRSRSASALHHLLSYAHRTSGG